MSFVGPPNLFNLNTTVTKTPRPDEVILTPADGFSRLYREAYVPDYAAMAPIGPTPIAIRFTLNEWFRFEKTGRYTMQIKTPRVTPRSRSSLYSRDDVLTTNSITFEIVSAVPEAEAIEVQRLVAIIDGTASRDERRTALDKLSLLTGDAEAREKVRRFLHPNEATPFLRMDPSALLASTNRGLVLGLLEEEFRSPDVFVRFDLITTMVLLRSTKHDAAAREIEAQYLHSLFESLPTRSPASSLSSAQVLLGGLQGLRRYGLPPEAAEMTRAAEAILRTNFASLSLESLEVVMRAYWKDLGDRSLVPTLERFLERPELIERRYTTTRGALLGGLMDVDAEAARPYVLAEIRRPESVLGSEVLGRLPDKQLPELDASLLSLVETLGPLKDRRDFVKLDAKAQLVARYASPSIHKELRSVYEQWGPSWTAGCRGSLLAYFLRWQGDAMLPMIEQEAAAVSTASGSDEILLESLARGYYSDSFNDLLERRLNGADRQAAASAAWVLGRHGSAKEATLLQQKLSSIDMGTDLATIRLRNALTQSLQTLKSRFR
jgi:hypothetical protein